jgi:uncharacterized protein DUF4194
MTWTEFGNRLDGLNSSEQAQFSESLRRLLANGWIWQEDEEDRHFYHFVTRHVELLQQYLQLSGWELLHVESLHLYHLRQTDGLHRRRLSKATTLWLLIVRLIYQEQREQRRTTLTALPLVKVSDLYDRYLSYFPNQRVRVKGEFAEALRELRAYRLVRAPEGGALRPDTPDKLIELLPALEIILPAATLSELAALVKEYQPDQAQTSGEEPA